MAGNTMIVKFSQAYKKYAQGELLKTNEEEAKELKELGIAEIILDKPLKENQMTAINFDGFSKKKINTAIDYVDDVCYIGLNLPIIKPMEQNKEIVMTETEGLCFINSNKEQFVATKEELNKRNIILKDYTTFKNSRWELYSIKKFIEGNSEPNFKNTFNMIKEESRKYIEYPDDFWHDIKACWIIGTYFYKLFSAYGILWYNGLMRTGKSKAGDFINLLAFNSVKSGLVSTAGLFRTIDSYSSTVVSDESENLSQNHNRITEMVTIINSGYKKGSPVIKTVELAKGFDVREFDTYSPKVICNVYGISADTMTDRAIKITMLRSKNPEILNSEIIPTDYKWQDIRNNLYSLALRFSSLTKRVIEGYKNNNIKSRELEIWKPVLVIAKIINETGLEETIPKEKLENFILEQIQAKEAEEQAEGLENLILKALENLVNNDVVMVSEIRNSIGSMVEDVSKISEKSIGRALGRLGFKDKKRVSSGIGYRITFKQYLDICERLKVEIDYKTIQDKQKQVEETTQTTLLDTKQ